jgi:DNA-binding Lrp family transcriptional regulator
MITTFSDNKKRIARRGIDETSSKILHLIFKAYPSKLSIRDLAKELKIKEKTTLTIINKIKISGIPICISKNQEKEKIVQASINEPISWIIKEKQSAEVMLELIGDLKMDNNNNGHINDKKNIIYRIYNEYVDLLNEVFDKWNSLRLFEQLSQDKK